MALDIDRHKCSLRKYISFTCYSGGRCPYFPQTGLKRADFSKNDP